MKKTFPLSIEGIQPPRVIAGIKSDVRKYLKRERRKQLPEGVDFWDFDCRTGKQQESSEETHVSALIEAIDTAGAEEWPAIYIEILAKAGHRMPRQKPQDPSDGGEP